VAILNAYNIYEEVDFEYTSEDYKEEQRIRSCIRRIYEGANAQHTYDGKLGYVLLIGDSKHITGKNKKINNILGKNPDYTILKKYKWFEIKSQNIH
jgi:hypothetical protein